MAMPDSEGGMAMPDSEGILVTMGSCCGERYFKV